MMKEEYSKSKKKPHNVVENQKLMMKISSTKNVSGNIGCVILLGGAALVTAAAVGSAFLISRKHKKSTNKITKKEGSEKIEDESSKGIHFLLPDSSPCMEQQQPSSNGTHKLCVNDNESTSLFSTLCLIQDEKPKLDERRDTLLNSIVSDHPKGGGKSPSFEELELPETKISLLPDLDEELDEVSRVRIEVIQGNEETEVLAHVHQPQATIFSNPVLQMDNKRELLVHNDDKGGSNEVQHTGVIETDNLEEGPIQEQEKQATGDQETSSCNEHESLNSAVDLMKAGDEDKDKDHLQCVYFEEQCADAETQIDHLSKKSDAQMQFSDEEECAKESDQANSCYEATSENSPCRTYSIVAPNLAASRIRNASINDEHSAEAYEDKDEGHTQIVYFEGQCVDAETKIDQIAKECNIKMQFTDEQVCSNENDQENSCYEEAKSENSHCRTYSMGVPNLAASEIRNASVHDQHSAEVIQAIKETKAMDPATGEQSPEIDYSPILFEKQSVEQNYQGNVLEEDDEASKKLCMDIEVAEKDLEAHNKEVKYEVEESVFVNEENEDDDDYNGVDNNDAAQEVEDDILEEARNSSEQFNSEKIRPADSNQELLLELKEEEGKQIKEDEACSVENCNLKSTQNDFAITSCQQSSKGKDDSTVNVTDSYRTKLMYLDDIAAITRGRRVLLGALLVLIWYFCLNAFFLPV